MLADINRYSKAGLNTSLNEFEVVFQPKKLEVVFQNFILKQLLIENLFSNINRYSQADLKKAFKSFDSNLKILRSSSKFSFFLISSNKNIAF